MEKKNKKILLITSAILLIGGGVGYWLWKRNKDKNAGKTDSDDKGTPSVDDDKGTPPKGEQPKVDKPANVTAFQDWMDKNHPNWVKGKNLNKGSGYGNFGAYTQKAWATYKAEYQKGSAPTTTTTPTNASGFKPNDLLYSKYNFDTARNYPSKDARYNIGKILPNGAKPSAKYVRDSTVKGWIVATAGVTNYNDKLEVVPNVFLEARNYTNVMP